MIITPGHITLAQMRQLHTTRSQVSLDSIALPGIAASAALVHQAAQGGDAVATVKAGWRSVDGETVAPIAVNASRSILYASSGADFAAAARAEALRTRALLNTAR